MCWCEAAVFAADAALLVGVIEVLCRQIPRSTGFKCALRARCHLKVIWLPDRVSPIMLLFMHQKRQRDGLNGVD
eukprot:2069418-Pleurochrysis_carterae.AAC.3